MGKPISRRRFIILNGKGCIGIGLSHSLAFSALSSIGCGSKQAKTVHGACYHDCPDTCSWTVTTIDNKVVRFEANASNPYTAGKLCSKMDDFPANVTFHPDRILTPLKRTGRKGTGEFQPISWEQALGEVAEKLRAVMEEKGPEAVLPYSFAGTDGLVQRAAISDRFFARLGATRLERTICGEAAIAGISATNGQTTGVLPEDIVHSRYIILWGTNPVISNQHLWPLIQKARQRGAEIVVIDPFQSQTALQADWHIQPLPGTDTALALALIHVILSENLHDQDYVERYTTGIDELKKHVQKYAPATVATMTGVDRETIVRLARKYAESRPSLIRVLIGLEHQTNGASAFRAVAMLPALTGAWRELGGGLMNMTYELFEHALNWTTLGLAQTLGNPETRFVNMVQIGRALADSSLRPGIHALFVYNSNPAVIAPNQNLVRKGLAREDLLTVVLEHFMTDTACYADYIFPATTQLEHWDLMISWGQAYINLNQPAIAPVGQAKSNSAFFRLLAREMGFQEEYLFETDLSIIKKTLDSDHDYMRGITFESLREKGWAKLNLPEPWLPHAEGNFGLPAGKCQFFNTSVWPHLPEYHPPKYSAATLKKYPLHLLTIKSTRNFLNSSHANVRHLREKEGRPFLDMHEGDARARGISDGDEVRVYNENGEVRLAARSRNKVRQGVVCMPQGFWPSLMKGGSSANALTSDQLTDMGDGAALQEARVQVARV